MTIKLMQVIQQIKSNKKYIIYSLANGLSSLIIPLGTQFLVNSLALSGVWFNTITFIIIVGMGLIISLVIKHCQLILVETLQREIFVLQIDKWKNLKETKLAHVYFEISGLLKSFSKAYSHLAELALMMIFGMTTIILFHPAFLILPISIGLVLFQISKSFNVSLKTSIHESNEKYKIYDQIASGQGFNQDSIMNYLFARNEHFSFTRSNSIKVSLLTFFSHLYLLGSGTYLIYLNQLSVGQLVSAEIIVSGIFISLLKLPLTLEAVYDYETSEYKISKIIGE